jgi:hypothetical protein
VSDAIAKPKAEEVDVKAYAAAFGALMVVLGAAIQATQLSSSAAPPHPHPVHANSKPKRKDCEVRSDLPQKALIENHSFTISVHVSLPQREPSDGSAQILCDSEVTILAPGFETKPESMKFHLPDAQGRKEKGARATPSGWLYDSETV